MLQKFHGWLEQELAWNRILRWYLVIIPLNIFLSMFAFGVLNALGVKNSDNVAPLDEMFANSNLLVIIAVITAMAGLEEVLFRLLPLGPAVRISKNPAWLIAVILISSAFFGYIHGGWANVAIQGVGGVMLSVLFLKSGGMQKKFWKPLISTTGCHALFNGTLLFLAFVSA